MKLNIVTIFGHRHYQYYYRLFMQNNANQHLVKKSKTRISNCWNN